METSGDKTIVLMLSKSNGERALHEAANSILDVENDANATAERVETAGSTIVFTTEQLAADDIRNFIGQPWENWAAALGRWSPLPPDEPPEVFESDCTTLSFEDKRWAGEMPGIEPFIAHVCKLCKAAVKPGFLTQHYALWHNVKPDDPVPPLEELEKDPLNTTLRIHRISPDCKLILGAPKVKIKKQKQEKSTSNAQNLPCAATTGILPSSKAAPITVMSALLANKGVNKAFSNSFDVCQETVPNISVSLPLVLPSSVPIKPVVTSSSVTKMGNLNMDLGVLLPLLPTAQGPAMSVPVLSVVPVVTSVTTVSQPLASPPPKKRPKIERKYLPVKDREYNPDKHCGVWNLETKKQCTRSLTCNCHSLSQRRAVTGRSKTFDNLLADHRAAKEISVLAAKPNVIQVSQQEKQGKCIISVSKASTVHQQDILPTHNFHAVTSGPTVSSAISHRQRHAVVSSLCFPVSSTSLLSVESLEGANKSLAPIIRKVTIAKFPPCYVDSSEPPGERNSVVKTKIDHHLSAETCWVKRHPKPLAVCSFAAHKVGTVLSHSKQMAVTRRILRTTLIDTLIEMPLSSNTFAPPVQVNHTAANISPKGNVLGGNNVVVITNITAKSTKVPFSRSSSNSKIVQSLGLTTAVPKTTSLKASSSSESALKSVQQFHVSTVLTPCSKQNEFLQHKRKGQVSRVKRKSSTHSCSGTVEVVGSVLPHKAGTKSRGSHMPLMTLAIANGLSSTSTGHIKMGEQKVVFVSQGTAVSDGFFTSISNNISSNITLVPDATPVSTKLKGGAEGYHNKHGSSWVPPSWPQLLFFLVVSKLTTRACHYISSARHQVCQDLRKIKKTKSGITHGEACRKWPYLGAL